MNASKDVLHVVSVLAVNLYYSFEKRSSFSFAKQNKIISKEDFPIYFCRCQSLGIRDDTQTSGYLQRKLIFNKKNLSCLIYIISRITILMLKPNWFINIQHNSLAFANEALAMGFVLAPKCKLFSMSWSRCYNSVSKSRL